MIAIGVKDVFWCQQGSHQVASEFKTYLNTALGGRRIVCNNCKDIAIEMRQAKKALTNQGKDFTTKEA